MARKSKAPKCVECGKRLTLFREAIGLVQVQQEPLQLVTEWVTRKAYGTHGNSIFCSHRCGYRFAVRWMRRIMFWR